MSTSDQPAQPRHLGYAVRHALGEALLIDGAGEQQVLLHVGHVSHLDQEGGHLGPVVAHVVVAGLGKALVHARGLVDGVQQGLTHLPVGVGVRHRPGIAAVLGIIDLDALNIRAVPGIAVQPQHKVRVHPVGDVRPLQHAHKGILPVPGGDDPGAALQQGVAQLHADLQHQLGFPPPGHPAPGHAHGGGGFGVEVGGRIHRFHLSGALMPRVHAHRHAGKHGIRQRPGQGRRGIGHQQLLLVQEGAVGRRYAEGNCVVREGEGHGHIALKHVIRPGVDRDPVPFLGAFALDLQGVPAGHRKAVMHAVRPGGDLRILDPAGDLLRGKPRGRRAGRGIGLGVQPGLQQRAPGQGSHVDAHPGIVKGAGQSANGLKMSVFRIQHLAAAIPLRIVFQVYKGILRHIEGKAHLVGRCFGGDFGALRPGRQGPAQQQDKQQANPFLHGHSPFSRNWMHIFYYTVLSILLSRIEWDFMEE